MAKKNIYIIIIALTLIIVLIGIFYWYQNREITGSPDDYLIIEIEEGIFVENKKAGLLVKAPAGWEVEKLEHGEGSILFYTPDIEGKEKENLTVPPLKKGCGIETSIVYKKMDFTQIREEVLSIHWGLDITSEEFEEININGFPALKNIFYSEIIGPAIIIYVPVARKVYDFGLYFAYDEEEKCIQKFNNFLDNIVIK